GRPSLLPDLAPPEVSVHLFSWRYTPRLPRRRLLGAVVKPRARDAVAILPAEVELDQGEPPRELHGHPVEPARARLLTRRGESTPRSRTATVRRSTGWRRGSSSTCSASGVRGEGARRPR